MSKLTKKLFALVCAAALLAGSHGLTAFAVYNGEPSGAGSTVLTCTELPLKIDDQYIGSGFIVDSVIYVPLLSFAELMLGDTCEVLWDQETGTAAINAAEFNLTLTTDQGYMTVNGRYVYFRDGVYNINGTILVPIQELSRVFGLGLEIDREDWALHIDTSESALFDHGAEFYDEDDLYWLSHVIYSEAGNQPLDGMIGVGNVVLNRMNDTSGAFQDTIQGVIFQYGQFDVVPTGAIYMTPNDDSVVAAKLCLEGYNTVGDSKWFLNPRYSNTSWFDIHTTYEITIADHVFYS